jgi:hypothetical protein
VGVSSSVMVARLAMEVEGLMRQVRSTDDSETVDRLRTMIGVAWL